VEDENNPIVEETSHWGGSDNNRLENKKKFADGSSITTTTKFKQLSDSELRSMRSVAPTTKLDVTPPKPTTKFEPNQPSAASSAYWPIVILAFLVIFVATAIPMDHLMETISRLGMTDSAKLGTASRNGVLSAAAVIVRIYVIWWLSKNLAKFVTSRKPKKNQ
jgi:hypothetical protein